MATQSIWTKNFPWPVLPTRFQKALAFGWVAVSIFGVVYPLPTENGLWFFAAPGLFLIILGKDYLWRYTGKTWFDVIVSVLMVTWLVAGITWILNNEAVLGVDMLLLECLMFVLIVRFRRARHLLDLQKDWTKSIG